MNLHLMSPIGYTGYGYAGLNILCALMKNEHNIGLSVIGNPNIETQTQAEIINKSLSYSHLIPYDSPSLKIWHQFDLLVRPGKGINFAFPFFEIDIFNQKELYSLNSVDQLIVSSQWAKEVMISNHINKPIHVVPLGVDSSLFDYQKNKQTNNYVFISIGKWEKRKSHDIIIECFNKAFNISDNVELWMVTHNPFLNQDEINSWLSLVETSPLKNKIKVFPRLENHEKLAEILSYSNCGIYISRGEGWNMELLETMSMNKPVIATNYSAHTEYCTKDNAFLVEIHDKDIAIDNKWFFGNSHWAKIDDQQKNQTIEYMQYCYKNNIQTNENGLKTAQKLTWENTATKLTGCIDK